MALDTYEVIWNRLRLRCPGVSSFLAKDWVRNSFRQVAERRSWSWLVKFGQFSLPAQTATGTATCVTATSTVTGIGTSWATTWIGQQFRVGVVSPIYTITAVDAGAQTLTLDSPWGGASVTSVPYQIYQAFVTAPADFHHFVTLWDVALNWQLHLNVQQKELNYRDAQRANIGQSYCVSERDYVANPSDPTGPQLPRFELWPHRVSQYVYPYYYVSRAADLEDTGATLPRYIRGDILLEMSLAQCARWPGTTEQPNPYFNIQLAREHDVVAETQIQRLEIQDDEVMAQDLEYAVNLPFSPWPLDAQWMQKHAV